MLGIDPDRLIPPAQQREKSEDYELPPEQWDAWQVFDALWTQWRMTVGWSRVVYEGLEYTSLESAMRMLGIPQKKWRDVFWMVRVMEDEARKLRNK